LFSWLWSFGLGWSWLDRVRLSVSQLVQSTSPTPPGEPWIPIHRPFLVLVGDDRHVISDGGQTVQGLADPDQVTPQAGIGKDGDHVAGSSGQSRHGGHRAAPGRQRTARSETQRA